MSNRAIAWTIAAILGCGDSSAAGECVECPAAAVIGALGDPQIRETSGITASWAHPGVWYVHNDAGDVARLFAIAGDGALRATLTLDAPNVDWEDIARGPCNGAQCLYVGDIGDNDGVRAVYAVYRVAEPVQLIDSAVAAEPLPFTYPDGPHDAETLLVDPANGQITVVTKVESGDSSIYEFPLPLRPGERVVLEPAGSVRPPQGSPRITGGDVHPDGTSVLLRTRSGVFYYSKRPDQSVASALAGDGCAGPKLDEEQGEAIAWTVAGDAWVSVGEGVGAALHRVACEP